MATAASFKRFLQEIFSCCAVESDCDIEKAAEMTDGEPRLSMMTMGMEDLEMGSGRERDGKQVEGLDVMRGPWQIFRVTEVRRLKRWSGEEVVVW